MSPRESADRLIRSFQTTARLLQQLQAGMVRRRTAWISARPSTLAEPATALERLAQELAAEERGRRELLDAMAAQLPPLPGVADARRRVDVRTVTPLLPPAQALALRRAADVATGLAKEIRREIALGERLLRFSARAQDALLQRLTGAVRGDDVPVYDRSARRTSGPLAGQRHGIGSLVDGRS